MNFKSDIGSLKLNHQEVRQMIRLTILFIATWAYIALVTWALRPPVPPQFRSSATVDGYSWNDPANWYPQRIPGPNDNVVFDEKIRQPGDFVEPNTVYWNQSLHPSDTSGATFHSLTCERFPLTVPAEVVPSDDETYKQLPSGVTLVPTEQASKKLDAETWTFEGSPKTILMRGSGWTIKSYPSTAGFGDEIELSKLPPKAQVK